MSQYSLFNKATDAKILPLGIPYMGAKKKHAAELMDVMLRYKPDAEVFVDLFGGGGSMSFAAMQRGLRVVYNDLDAGMANLMRFIFSRMGQRGSFGMFPDEYYEWVSREQFMELRDGTDAYSQFVKVCYSFGNNCRTYFSNKKLEHMKMLLHQVVVYRDVGALAQFNADYGYNVVMSDAPYYQDRRLEVMKQVKSVGRLEQLERLQQLEQLQQLERPSGAIEIHNCDFRDISILENAIVYLDPPYRGTGKYNIDTFHGDIDDYFGGLDELAFMSEYNAPFECVWSKETRSTLSSTNNKTKAVERLYVNRI